MESQRRRLLYAGGGATFVIWETTFLWEETVQFGGKKTSCVPIDTLVFTPKKGSLSTYSEVLTVLDHTSDSCLSMNWAQWLSGDGLQMGGRGSGRAPRARGSGAGSAEKDERFCGLDRMSGGPRGGVDAESHQKILRRTSHASERLVDVKRPVSERVERPAPSPLQNNRERGSERVFCVAGNVCGTALLSQDDSRTAHDFSLAGRGGKSPVERMVLAPVQQADRSTSMGPKGLEVPPSSAAGRPTPESPPPRRQRKSSSSLSDDDVELDECTPARPSVDEVEQEPRPSARRRHEADFSVYVKSLSRPTTPGPRCLNRSDHVAPLGKSSSALSASTLGASGLVNSTINFLDSATILQMQSPPQEERAPWSSSEKDVPPPRRRTRPPVRHRTAGGSAGKENVHPEENVRPEAAGTKRTPSPDHVARSFKDASAQFVPPTQFNRQPNRADVFSHRQNKLSRTSDSTATVSSCPRPVAEQHPVANRGAAGTTSPSSGGGGSSAASVPGVSVGLQDSLAAPRDFIISRQQRMIESLERELEKEKISAQWKGSVEQLQTQFRSVEVELHREIKDLRSKFEE